MEKTRHRSTYDPYKPFDAYEVEGCKVVMVDSQGKGCIEPVEDHEADFWTLYGHSQGQGVDAIADFDTRQEAERMMHRITGGT